VRNENIQHDTVEMDHKREIEEYNVMEENKREGIEESMQCNATRWVRL
jgi:hypothetical protein